MRSPCKNSWHKKSDRLVKTLGTKRAIAFQKLFIHKSDRPLATIVSEIVRSHLSVPLGSEVRSPVKKTVTKLQFRMS
jgi:hypothetical protein